MRGKGCRVAVIGILIALTGGLVTMACGGGEESPRAPQSTGSSAGADGGAATAGAGHRVEQLPVYSPDSAGWKLAWHDEFDAGVLDAAVWEKCERGTVAWNKYMSPASELYGFRDGNLILRGMVNPDTVSDPVPYITGGVYTKDKKAFAPGGYIEVRAKLQGAKGAWPAIWMLPFDRAKYHWPQGGEVDICERLNFDAFAHQTVHSPWTVNLRRTQNPPATKASPIDADGYNTYGAQILPDRVVFFINGKPTFEYPKINGGAMGQYPFENPMYLLIDMQLGGDWVGEVNPADLPVEMAVDYVRFWEYRAK